MLSALKNNIEFWMRAERIGVAPHSILASLSFLYGAGVRARNLLYRIGALSAHALPCKVVSVGNITVGGTGKTPLTIAIAGYLKDKGLKVAVISRGYKRESNGILAVSDGVKTLAAPQEAGDEPCLMAERLKGVPVIVSADRVKGGLYAVERFKPDVIVLDDAFQHLRLRRDLDVLLIDGAEGFGNGYLLPRGILREPLSGLKRASVALIKNGPLERPAREALNATGLPQFNFKYRTTSLCELSTGRDAGAGFLVGKKVVAVSGIANPDSFYSSVKALGATIVRTIRHPDHHAYSVSDASEMRRSLTGADVLVTTEKDMVKLKGIVRDLPVYVLSVDADIEGMERFARLIDSALSFGGL